MKAKQNTFDMQREELWRRIPLKTPFLLGIEPTFACNFRCGYCMHSSAPAELERNRGYRSAPMEWDTFLLTVEQMKAFPDRFKKVTLAGDGEPLLNPRLPEMVDILRTSGTCEKILVITNGSLLTPSMGKDLVDAGLTELKISLQGLSSEKYKEIAGVSIDFDKFYENIRRFYEYRKQTVLKLKIADTALQDGDEAAFYKLFGDICDFIAVEHIYQEFFEVDYAGAVLPDAGKTRFGHGYAPTQVCGEIFFKINVLRSGEITFGCPDGVTYKGFNINGISLLDAWNSKEIRQLQYDHLIGRLENHPQCVGCTRWDYSVVPEDMIDGHQDDILGKMETDAYNTPGAGYRAEKISCYSYSRMTGQEAGKT